MGTTSERTIHPDFLYHLEMKEQPLIELFKDVRQFILELAPDSNELLYHTHALTAVFSITDKLGDAFVHIPIYTNHLNLGFNEGALLEDPHNLLRGTGKAIRHLEVKTSADYRKDEVRELVMSAITMAEDGLNKPVKSKGKTISKIKTA